MLDHSNWEKHRSAGRHLEVISCHDAFPRVLLEPDIVVQANRDDDLHFHKQGVGTGRFTNHYLHLVVKRLGPRDPDPVVSWWFSPNVFLKGSIVWPR